MATVLRILAAGTLAALLGAFAWADGDGDSASHPEPRWVAADARLIPIAPGAPGRDSLPSWPVPFDPDGRFLYGVTPGYTVSPGTGLWLRPYSTDGRLPAPFRILAGEPRAFPFSYGPGSPVDVPVEFFEDGGRWRYRIPAVLELAAEDLRLCLIDGDGDGWFDDLDDDRVAFGTAQDLRRLKWLPFPGEVTQGGRRWLIAANPREALLWPVSTGVRRDYVRHVAEINALRRHGGLPPVGLAEELIHGCEAHSAYCGNWGMTHHESPGQRGYSRAGAWAGLHSNIAPAPNAISGIRLLLKTLWHRNHYYAFGLRRVGVGAAADVVTSDVLTHAHPNARSLVFAPIDRSLDAPLAGETEVPWPYVKEERPGPFITVLLPRGTPAQFRSGSVTPRGGKPLLFDVHDPARPAPAARKQVPDNDSCIVLILHRTLEAGTLYDVKVSATLGEEEREFVWSFRTRDKR